MSRIIFFLVLAAIYFTVDIYSYQGLKPLLQSKVYSIVYWSITALFFAGIIRMVFFFQDFHGVRPLWINIVIGLVFTIFVTKLFLALLFLAYDSGRVISGVVQYFRSITTSFTPDSAFIPSRRKAVTGVIAGIAAIPFLGFLYGITKGKYNYEISKLVLEFDDLPTSFDGFKIIQISDIHSGSYDSKDQVEKGIDLVNSLDPDMVVFTGDLVNSDKDEIDPYVDIFAKLSSKEGNYSITGNHDYYVNRNGSLDNKDAYWNDFKKKHKDMKFDLLLNENRLISRGADSIRLVGVENWGRGPFPKRGDLNKALKNVDENEFTVLLSHDPTHWDDHTLKNPKHVHLTLSGHTHGMQFGINALGIKWSPIKYRYSKWAGLYTEQNQHLYINRGFGFLGFPGRVGMWPEITEITLKKA